VSQCLASGGTSARPYEQSQNYANAIERARRSRQTGVAENPPLSPVARLCHQQFPTFYVLESHKPVAKGTGKNVRSSVGGDTPAPRPSRSSHMERTQLNDSPRRRSSRAEIGRNALATLRSRCGALERDEAWSRTTGASAIAIAPRDVTEPEKRSCGRPRRRWSRFVRTREPAYAGSRRFSGLGSGPKRPLRAPRPSDPAVARSARLLREIARAQVRVLRRQRKRRTLAT
jgi:hypothetical protein